MKTSSTVIAALVATAGALAWKSAPTSAAPALALDAVDLHAEVDALTGAAELVLIVEAGEALSTLHLIDTAGERVINFACAKGLRVGMHELELEASADSLPALFAKFPEGTYFVRGQTLRGEPVSASIDFEHRMPARFTVLSPLPDAVLPRDAATVVWTRSSGAVSYVLEIESSDERVSLEIAVPAEVTEFTIPSALLEPGQVYDYSLTAQGDTDNETELEGSFRAGG